MPPCLTCGTTKKTREAKRCRKCAGEARRRHEDRDHERQREWQKEFRKTPAGQRHTRSMNLRKFGLTLETYEALLEKQGGVCASCKRPEKARKDGTPGNLSVDHDHSCCPGQYSCGECIRGLLCNMCNRALGLLGDSEDTLQGMLAYLQASKER